MLSPPWVSIDQKLPALVLGSQDEGKTESNYPPANRNSLEVGEEIFQFVCRSIVDSVSQRVYNADRCIRLPIC